MPVALRSSSPAMPSCFALLNSPIGLPRSCPIRACCKPLALFLGGAKVSCLRLYIAYCPGSLPLSLVSSHGTYVRERPLPHNLKMALTGSELRNGCLRSGRSNDIHSCADACGETGTGSHDQSSTGPVCFASPGSSSFSSRAA